MTHTGVKTQNKLNKISYKMQMRHDKELKLYFGTLHYWTVLQPIRPMIPMTSPETRQRGKS